MKQTSLFGDDPGGEDGDDIRGMVHHGDPYTSEEAAVDVLSFRTELHQRVRDAFKAHPRLTDEELEQLEEFTSYGPSTIRKRRSELFQAGELRSCGDKRNSRGKKMLIWELVPTDEGEA